MVCWYGAYVYLLYMHTHTHTFNTHTHTHMHTYMHTHTYTHTHTHTHTQTEAIAYLSDADIFSRVWSDSKVCTVQETMLYENLRLNTLL